MFVEGNPAPTFKFFKGTQEIIEGGRYKLISNGDNNNMIMMAIAKVKAADESEYRVEIENCHGSDEANFMLFVSGYFYVYLSNRLDHFLWSRRYLFLFFFSLPEGLKPFDKFSPFASFREKREQKGKILDLPLSSILCF